MCLDGKIGVMSIRSCRYLSSPCRSPFEIGADVAGWESSRAFSRIESEGWGGALLEEVDEDMVLVIADDLFDVSQFLVV